jgi:signal transduction histidine kinase
MMKKTVLLVDDEKDICDVLSISLSDLGYEVFTAQSGEEALKILSKVNPLIVLTDIRMPFMDGIELLREIKHNKPDTEVIMLLKLEATDFITKPIKNDVLEIALKRALERFSMRQQLREYTENLEGLVREKTAKLVTAERMAAVGETIAGLSHAIKNIAGGLEGGTFVLEKGIELDNKQYIHQGWEAVRVSFEKIRELSVDLLNYAKFTDLSYSLSDPNQPAKEVVELLRSRADEHGIDLKIDLSPDLQPVWLDPVAIHHCLLNLVTNAMEATLSDNSASQPKKVLLMTTKPEGWGVFSSFFSTKGATGTGIGLMITKKIIDDHGGVIEFETKKGAGTKFIIRIPERTHAPESDS